MISKNVGVFFFCRNIEWRMLNFIAAGVAATATVGASDVGQSIKNIAFNKNNNYLPTDNIRSTKMLKLTRSCYNRWMAGYVLSLVANLNVGTKF